MKRCASCGAKFEPKRAHHRYCEACWSDQMAEERFRRRPPGMRHPQWRWLDPVRLLLWATAAAVVIGLMYVLGMVLGWW